MNRRYLLVPLTALMIAVILPSVSRAQDPHDHETEQVTLPPAQERRAKKLEEEFIAPCCWHQPVADHSSQIAKQMKAEIRTMIAQGSTDEQIRQRYIREYGERIMTVPPGGGFNHLAWIIPLIASIFGIAIAAHLLKSWRGEEPAPEMERGKDAPSVSHSKVDAQLKEWTE